MKEKNIIQYIEKTFKYYNRFYINFHGTNFGKVGVSDFITLDKDSVFTAIEVKTENTMPYANQYRRALEILSSGGRFIVAKQDFSIQNLDNHTIPKIPTQLVVGKSEYDLLELKTKTSFELIAISSN